MWHKQDASNYKVLPVQPNNTQVTLDEKGYFLIRLNPMDDVIEAGFCNPQHEMLYVWRGNNPMDLCKAIDEAGVLGSYAHAMYLGRELQRAHECLILEKSYIQD